MKSEDEDKARLGKPELEEKALAYLQGLSEQALTCDILIPLMRALGFERIDYHGGPYEGGKDLICWRTDELGDAELAVAQVKRYRLTPKALSSRSFMGVVNQLQQATEQRVPGTDGQVHVPRIVYFITPHMVDARSLAAGFDQYAALRTRRVKIIDGPILLQLLRRHLPELLQEILGTEAAIERTVRRELNNQVLLRALDAKGGRDLRSYYSNLDISIGGDVIEKLLLCSFSPQTVRLLLNKREWPGLLAGLLHLESLGIVITNEPVGDINFRLRQNSRKRDLFQIESEQALERSAKSQPHAMLESDPQSPVELSIEIESTPSRDIPMRKSRNLSEPHIEVSIDGEKLASFLVDQRDWLSDRLRLLREEKSRYTSDFRELLVVVSKVFSVAYETFREPHLMEAVGATFASPGEAQNQLGLSIHDVLRSGQNIAVLGEAGAGKTTCLQMHALQLLDERPEGNLVLYIPLAPAIAHYLGLEDADKDWHPTSHLFRLILSFLSSKETRISESDLREALRARSAILLLDGVDEVIKPAPWVLDAVREFPRSYSQTQIIISARLGTDHLARLPFAPVALLPFSDQQRRKFISDWFEDDSSKTELILKHVEEARILSGVLRSPLLCTILCVLAENDIPLPSAELRLYQERLRLLLGDYDIFKQASRLKSHRYNLEIVARRLAFSLHREGITEAPIAKLISLAKDSLEGKLREEDVGLAVRELANPCNILVPMSIDGGLGFGHLRYQEHLAALELSHNRGVEVGPLVYDSWWRGVLMFFALLTDDLDFLVDWFLDNGAYSRTDLQTLEDMVMAGHSVRKLEIIEELRARAELIMEITS